MSRCRRPAILPFASTIALPLPVEVQRFERGHFVGSAGLHGHRFHEIVLFESAGDVHRVGAHEMPSTVGSVDAIGEGQVHDLDLSPDARGWMLLFSDAALERAKIPVRSLRRFSRRGTGESGRCALSVRRLERMALYFSTLEGLQRDGTPARQRGDGDRSTVALFSTILHELAIGHALQTPTAGPYRHFETLLQTIDECYTRRVSLGELSAAVGLSKAFLTTDLRERTGRTAMQWLLARRMREARRLLVETDLPITRLALDVGFDDSSHFARRFRATHDTSPGRWRAAQRRRR